MAQGDYLIQNQTFPSFRTDLNSTLEAINTSNSGTSRPSSAVAGTVWLDTTNATNPTLKFFDGTDDISLAQFDYSANTVNWLDSTVVFDIVNDLSPQLGAMLDINGNAIGNGTEELIKFSETASAVNEVTVTNSATGNAPEISATGDDTNIDFKLTPKGSGNLVLDGLKYPNADGSADQVLKTDGSGNLSFTDVSGGTSWQSSIKTSAFTAVAGEGYWINTTSGAVTVTLPASASVGDTIELVDYARNWGTNKIIIDSNGLNYQGDPDTSTVEYNTNGQSLRIVYSGVTQGWIPTVDDDVTDAPIVPPYDIDFLVIAGGGAGTGRDNAGGGGAGGYRTSTETGITIGTVITVTVGDGGASSSGATQGNDGSNSSISGSGLTTITSTGGGGGGGNTSGRDGGSAGGGSNGQAGGSGNTPSTSPSQGNDGGDGTNSASAYGAGGGGGASAVGADGTGSAGGNGGDGLASSITGSSITRAGGGGGGGDPASGGSGGAGGGGAAGNGTDNGVAGTANTGGGGGGSSHITASGGACGKGVVILSMPDASYSGTTTGSPTVATGVSGKTVLTFTGSGSYTS